MWIEINTAPTADAGLMEVNAMRRGPRRRGRWLLVQAVALVLVLVLAVVLAVASPLARAATDRYYLPRVMLWQDADAGDVHRFPSRAVRAAATPFVYPTAPSHPNADPRLQTVRIEQDGRMEERRLDELLTSTGTTAFIVIQNDRLIDERYPNGGSRESTQTSFSVAKSFVSALVGIAIAEGKIGSVDDPITTYLPELRERDSRFEQVTIGDLLSMSSGLRYDDGGLPWRSDDTRTYYATDLRELALNDSRVESEPGKQFEYNNYHPLLLGLILERVTGMPVTQYLQETLWQPLGMEGDGSWSLDSDASGFEKMESGINARAIDFAKLGSLYLHGGAWHGQQVVPRAWVEASTMTQITTPSGLGYGYFWWIGTDGHYAARGNLGQYIFVAPEKGLVIVRCGTRYGLEGEGPAWIETFEAIAARF